MTDAAYRALFAAPVVAPDVLKDAQRYRWIKSEDSDPESLLLIGVYDEYGRVYPWADDLDAAIDAAMGGAND